MSQVEALKAILLDPEKRSPEDSEFEENLRNKIAGQDRAVRHVARMLKVFQTGMSLPGKPLGNLLFLGPTGTGKTRVVEAAAEILFGSSRAFIKIDCAEYQHGHEVAKLIGSPPGYLGHRETPPLLTQKALEEHHTDDLGLSFVLFDEIEKANDALWHLLLGILDKGTLTLGDNQKVDFSRTIVFMTSNLGSKQIGQLISGKQRRREHALKLLNEGYQPVEVARTVGVDRRSVRRWNAAYREQGSEGIAARPAPGRPPKLDLRAQGQLERILMKGAEAAGFSSNLWTCPRVAEIIRKRFRVRYHVDHIGRLLHSMGWTPQKPQRRAVERDEEAIQRWIKQDWGRIKKKPRG